MNNSFLKQLALLSFFCIIFEVARIYISSSINFIFLPANLFLAWIPVFLALKFHREENRLYLLLWGTLWLTFFPNAPYLITDIIHLKQRGNIPIWFDATMLYSFALTGILAGIYSTVLVYERICKVFPVSLSKIIIGALMILSGYGVYMGRMLRWNSWNIVTHPGEILVDTYHRIHNPFAHPGTYGMTLLFGSLLCILFLLFEPLLATSKEK